MPNHNSPDPAAVGAVEEQERVVAIAFCVCCGARPQIVPLLGIYRPGDGWYCLPCERAIRRAPRTELTPEAHAFVRRLSTPTAPTGAGR